MGVLTRDFLGLYSKKPVDWGFRSGPNSVGEITFRRTYSRDGDLVAVGGPGGQRHVRDPAEPL